MRKINRFTASRERVDAQKLSRAFAVCMCVMYISCSTCTKTLLSFCVYEQRLCHVFAVYVIAMHVNQSDKAKNRSIYHIMQTCRCAKAESCLRSVYVFFSSLSACSLWLWHCLGAVRMLGYMYLDQSRCFISSHWSITSIVCANKRFQPNNFFLPCPRFLAPSCSSHSTLSFSIVISLSQFEYFSSTLALRSFQSWW